MGKWLYILMLTSNMVLASGNYSLNIKNLSIKQNVTKLLDLPKNMLMSNNPEELSQSPQVACFNVDIDEYIPSYLTHKKQIYGCIFSDHVSMNAALLRARLYVHTKSSMTSDKELFGSKLMKVVGSHDFNGKDLVKYKNNLILPEDNDVEYKELKSIEKEFDQKVISNLINNNKDNFIFFAIANTKKYKENLSYELLHAQYYNTPKLKDIIAGIWDKIEPEHKKIITNALKDGGYDIDQQELLRSEFYSLLMQYNAEDYLSGIEVLAPMSKLVNIYYEVIQNELDKNNIKLITLSKLLYLSNYHDPILRKKLAEVKFPLSAEDREIIYDMKYSIKPTQLKAVHAPWTSAAGMAANQWGINKRIFLYCPTGDTINKLEVVINPSYEPLSNDYTQDESWEGCFSVPLAVGNVKRYKYILAKYQNESGNYIERELRGWDARVWQHETDHLDGHLYDDPRTHKCLEKKVFKNYEDLEDFFVQLQISDNQKK